MQTNLAIDWNPHVDTIDNPTNPNVVVLYEDVIAGRRAVHLLTKLCDRPDSTLELRPELWRLDILADPRCFGTALTSALDADILVISTSSHDSLNFLAESWIRLWLEQRRGTGGVIVEMLCAADAVEVLASPRFQMLRTAAQEAGVDLLVSQSPLEYSLSAIADKTAPLPISKNGEADFVSVPISTETLSRLTPYQYCALND